LIKSTVLTLKLISCRPSALPTTLFLEQTPITHYPRFAPGYAPVRLLFAILPEEFNDWVSGGRDAGGGWRLGLVYLGPNLPA
jgi:hypothetical protein